MGKRHESHSMACLPACSPPPLLEVATTSVGLVLSASCPSTNLGLGVLAAWDGREVQGQPHHHHSAPALSNLLEHNIQRWGWEKAGTSQVTSGISSPLARNTARHPAHQGHWLGSSQGHQVGPQCPAPPFPAPN